MHSPREQGSGQVTSNWTVRDEGSSAKQHGKEPVDEPREPLIGCHDELEHDDVESGHEAGGTKCVKAYGKGCCALG